jgi:hypothetical protein
MCAIDPEVCQEYFSRDILTPLGILLPQVRNIYHQRKKIIVYDSNRALGTHF